MTLAQRLARHDWRVGDAIQLSADVRDLHDFRGRTGQVTQVDRSNHRVEVKITTYVYVDCDDVNSPWLPTD